jgi:uncharacterized protein YkwD
MPALHPRATARFGHLLAGRLATVLAGALLVALAGAGSVAARVSSTAASACPGALVNPGGQNIGHADRAILCLVNERRAQSGLAPLHADAALGQAASRHSEDMVAEHYFAHDSHSGATPDARARAVGVCRTACVFEENIAWGVDSQGRPAAIVANWMASPPHRAAILDPRLRITGIGVAFTAPDGQRPGATVTEDFAS